MRWSKQRKSKKNIAIVLIVAMLLTIMPITVFASDGEDGAAFGAELTCTADETNTTRFHLRANVTSGSHLITTPSLLQVKWVVNGADDGFTQKGIQNEGNVSFYAQQDVTATEDTTVKAVFAYDGVEFASNEVSLELSDAIYQYDAESRTLYYRGDTFSVDVLLDPDTEFCGTLDLKKGTLETPVQTLVLDNPQMVTTASANTKLDSVKGIQEIVVKQANTIGKNTFYHLGDVQTIAIANVDTIETAAFSCSNVIDITITNVGDISGQAFKTLNALKTVTLSEIDSIGAQEPSIQGAFDSNSNKTATAVVSDVNQINCLGFIFEKVALNSVKRIEARAFARSSIKNNLKELTLTDVDYVGKYAFEESKMLVNGSLTSVVISNTVVDEYAFFRNSKLQNVTLENAVIAGHAFEGCTALEDIVIDDATQLGYSAPFANIASLQDRILAIMQGQFQLKDVRTEDEMLLPEEGYTSKKVGIDHSADANGTQVTKSAKWNDTERTIADVGIQFRYGQNQGMDFLFVVDYSASMAMLGNDTSKNSRYYELESKVLDVSQELLTKEGYANQVGILTFGGYYNDNDGKDIAGDFHEIDFTNDSDNLQERLMAVEHKGHMQNTDYLTALDKAQEMIANRPDQNRQVAVIFISDGAPTVDKNKYLYVPQGEALNSYKHDYIGSDDWYGMLQDIEAKAETIKATGTSIIGVTQSVPAAEEFYCNEAMQLVCSEKLIFPSSDTAGFSEAVNNAVATAFHVYTLTDIVHPDFVLDESTVKVDTGYTKISTNEAGNTVIIWTIYGSPYTTYHLTYQEVLKQVDGKYPVGTFDTNDGDVVITTDGDEVNRVETPQLPREEQEKPPTEPTTPPSSGGDDDDWTPSDKPKDPPTEIDEPEVPLVEPPVEPEEPAEAIDEPDVPLTEVPGEPVEEIAEPEVPLGDAPRTGDAAPVVGLVALLLAAGVGLVVTRKKMHS